MSKKPNKVLARPGDPYLLDDGRTVESDRSTMNMEGDRIKTTPELYKPTKRRSVKELPADVAVLKGIACVFVFTLLGMGDREMAESLGITTNQVRLLRNNAAYGEVFDIICGEFINANSNLVMARLNAHAHAAVDTVATVMKTGKEGNRLKAADSILNRGGHGPKDGIANIGSRNDLRIVITRNDDTKPVEISI